MKLWETAILMVIVLWAAACGSGIYTIPAEYPDNPLERYKKTHKIALIKSVTDDRDIQAMPGPSKPSGTLPAAEQSRLLGAKSGSANEEFKGIFLPEDQTVESVISDLLSVALDGAGFLVITDAATIDDPPDVELTTSIVRLWIKTTSDFATIGIEADVVVSVFVTLPSDPDGKTYELSARGYLNEPDMGKSPDSYRVVFKDTLKDFLADLQKQCTDITTLFEEE